jgi:hypothetical protein
MLGCILKVNFCSLPSRNLSDGLHCQLFINEISNGWHLAIWKTVHDYFSAKVFIFLNTIEHLLCLLQTFPGVTNVNGCNFQLWPIFDIEVFVQIQLPICKSLKLFNRVLMVSGGVIVKAIHWSFHSGVDWGLHVLKRILDWYLLFWERVLLMKGIISLKSCW